MLEYNSILEQRRLGLPSIPPASPCSPWQVGVPLDAEVSHIPDPATLRVRVQYPDHTTHLILPPHQHLTRCTQCRDMKLRICNLWITM